MQRSLFSTLIVAGALSVTSIALANDLDVPVTEEAGDGQIANCSSAMVSGLKANGDGFLAVRSGPAANIARSTNFTMEKRSSISIVMASGRELSIVHRTRIAIQFQRNATRSRMRKKAGFIPNGSNQLLTNSAAPCTIIDLRLWQGFQAVTKSAPL